MPISSPQLLLHWHLQLLQEEELLLQQQAEQGKDVSDVSARKSAQHELYASDCRITASFALAGKLNALALQ